MTSADLKGHIIKPASNTEYPFFSVNVEKNTARAAHSWITGRLSLGWRNYETLLEGKKRSTDKEFQHFWSDLRQGKKWSKGVVKH